MAEEPVLVEGTFDSWYRAAWASLVVALSATFQGNADLGEECAAEACARAFAHWSRVSGMASPTAWAYRVGVNHGKRKIRRRTAEARLADGRVRTTVDPDLPTDLLDRLAALPTRQREVVVLRYFLDMTQEQIARHLRISPGAAAASLHKARARLLFDFAAEPEPEPSLTANRPMRDESKP